MKIVDIQGLRSISMLMILLHQYWPQFFPQGRFGIDILFVISGFSMARMLSDGKGRLSNYPLQFYWHRAKRFFPIYYLVLFLSVILMYLSQAESIVEPNLVLAKKALVFLTNIREDSEIMQEVPSSQLFLSHFWPIATEAQFHVFAPFVARLVIGKSVRRKTFLLFLLFGASLLLFVNVADNINSPFARVWQFSIGFLAFYNCESSTDISPSKKTVTTCLGSCFRILPLLTIFMITFLDTTNFFMETVFRLMVTCSAGWISMKTGDNTIPILRNYWLTKFSDSIFVLYLVSWPILCIVRLYSDPSDVFLSVLVSFVVSLLSAVVLHKLFEKRFLAWSDSVNVITIVVLITICSASIFISFDRTIFAFSKFPWSPQEQQFIRNEEVRNIDCRRLFDGDQKYIKEVAKSRPKMVFGNHSLSCEAIRERVNRFHAPSVNYSIAFAKIVYVNYDFLELQLAASYQADNHYCFSIDSKSHAVFRHKMKMLASCLPNVYIASDRRKLDSLGHNINTAHQDCLEVLLEQKEWNYVLLMQNDDIIVRTNAELVEILKVLNGSNDVSIRPVLSGRINMKMKWDPKSLKLFTKNTPLTTGERENATLEFAKGGVQSSISREAADWMVNKVNLATMIKQLNSARSGADEQLLNTLHNSERLKMPGGFHSACLKNNITTTSFTRYAKWSSNRNCKSGKVRHSICILGVEDLEDLDKSIRHEHIMANKMMPAFDFAAISCVAELLFNKTRTDIIPEVNHAFFANFPVVKYNEMKKDPTFKPEDYKCEITSKE